MNQFKHFIRYFKSIKLKIITRLALIVFILLLINLWWKFSLLYQLYEDSGNEIEVSRQVDSSSIVAGAVRDKDFVFFL